MNNFVTHAIANVASILKSLRLKQTLMVLLAGFFLLTSNACGRANATLSKPYDYNAEPNPTQANERASKTSSPYDKGTGPQHELYKPIQQPRDGMNTFNDDLQYEKEATGGKAKQLIDRAENRLQKRAESPQELIDNARESNPFEQGSRDVSKRINSVVESAKDNIADDLEKGSRNLKENLRQAQHELPNVVEKAKDNASEATRSVREGAKDFSKGVQ